MFRPLRKIKRAISDEEIQELLKTSKCGIFAVNGDDGYPFAVPVNYFYDYENQKIYFHGAKEGHKVDSLKKSDKICFTVFGQEFHKNGETAPYVQSVVIFGRCRLVFEDAVKEQKVRELAAKFLELGHYSSQLEIEEEIKRGLGSAQLYEISIEHVCGKQIQEK